MPHTDHIRVIIGVIALSLIACPAFTEDGQSRIYSIKNAEEKPDFSRLPVFYTSEPAYDEFINEYFLRHLSVDESGVYWQHGPVPGVAGLMWVVEWDTWFFKWIDRGAMGLQRQNNRPHDTIINTLLNVVVDKYGYTWGANLIPERKYVIGGHAPTFSWPWPKYNWNRTVERPTGWEFNDIADGSRDEWSGNDIIFEPGYVDFSLLGTITGPNPEILTPEFDVDVLHVPIIELDLTYTCPENERADRFVHDLKIYWTTTDSPEFSEDRMVTVDFSALPPKDFARHYTNLASKSEARYPLYFPMYLHPEWGRNDRRITGLKIVPAGEGAEGVTLSFNYIRASYDARMSVTNAALISSAARMFMWSGDENFLRLIMPGLRKSMVFLNEHLRGKEEALLNLAWMVGKDGLGGDKPGHGIIGSYWDLLPAGRYDIESSMHYYEALLAMAALEKAAADRGIEVNKVSVLGPDNKTRLEYRETPESLKSLAARVRTKIEETFWNENTGRFFRNIDVDGNKHDYGFLHFNLLALTLGIGAEKQRDSILSWLDGRKIPGDTSGGADIYKWRFAPRTSTRRNDSYYYWPWLEGMKNDPQPLHEFGNQMQDGGAVPFTSLFETMVRVRTGKQDQIDRAFARSHEIRDWFMDVKAAGGEGADFYRAYYRDRPDRGLQQGGGPPGGLGLDREFLSDSCLGTVFPLFAFMGVDAIEDRVLSIAPAVPSELDKVGVRNVFYHNNYLTIEAGKDYVSLAGSRITDADGLKVRVTLPNVPEGAELFLDGKPHADVERAPDGRATIFADLKPLRIEARQTK